MSSQSTVAGGGVSAHAGRLAPQGPVVSSFSIVSVEGGSLAASQHTGAGDLRPCLRATGGNSTNTGT